MTLSMLPFHLKGLRQVKLSEQVSTAILNKSCNVTQGVHLAMAGGEPIVRS